MHMHTLGSVFKLWSFLGIYILFGTGNVLAGTQDKAFHNPSAIEHSLGKAPKSKNLLQGGVKEDASLHPSLKVLPAPSGHGEYLKGWTSQNMYPLDADLVQYAGGTKYIGGQPAPKLRSLLPSIDRSLHGVIPPISSYLLVPHNTIMWSAPGYDIFVHTSSKTDSNHFSSFKGVSFNSGKGVNSWDNGYETKRQNVRDHIPMENKGITSWVPGYEVSKTQEATFVVGTGNEVKNTDHSDVTQRSSTSPVFISTSRRGVVCWAPGYEVSVQSASLVKTSLGGFWSAPAKTNTPKFPDWTGKTFLQAVAPPLTLVAPTLSLPGAKPLLTNSNDQWNNWYKSIARAIYARWQCAEVGPGLATVRVSVTKDRFLSCQIVDFSPLNEGERNVASEQAFREAAVKAVNDVNKFEIPELPPLSGSNQVTFDVQMKRTVDGPSGIDITKVHTD